MVITEVGAGTSLQSGIFSRSKDIRLRRNGFMSCARVEIAALQARRNRFEIEITRR
jgi:hypothetical protein